MFSSIAFKGRGNDRRKGNGFQKHTIPRLPGVYRPRIRYCFKRPAVDKGPNDYDVEEAHYGARCIHAPCRFDLDIWRIMTYLTITWTATPVRLWCRGPIICNNGPSRKQCGSRRPNSLGGFVVAFVLGAGEQEHNQIDSVCHTCTKLRDSQSDGDLKGT